MGVSQPSLLRPFSSRLKDLSEAVQKRDFRKGGALPPFTNRDAVGVFLGMLVWLLAVSFAFFLAMEEDKRPEPHADPALALLMVVMIGGGIGLVALFIVTVRRHQRDAVRERMLTIVLDDRAARAKRGMSGSGREDNSPSYWATKNYDPERYWNATRDWSPEYRDYVKDAYGDLDTYEANQPD